MYICPYLSFDGTCAEAFAFYAHCFGTQIGMTMRWRDTPMAGQAPPDLLDKIAHTRIKVGDAVLMGSDAPPGRYQKTEGMTVSVNVTDPAEAERVFGALAEGGAVTMPIGETFWAQRFGMLTDRFGIPWMVNCETAPG